VDLGAVLQEGSTMSTFFAKSSRTMEIMQTVPPTMKSEQMVHLVRLSSFRPMTTGMGRRRSIQSVMMFITPMIKMAGV
jgi:hypothetical protein